MNIACDIQVRPGAPKSAVDQERQVRVVDWLESRPRLIIAQRGGGFYVTRGHAIRRRDGETVDLLDALLSLGFRSGLCVGGYSIVYTPPGGLYLEKLTFFPMIRRRFAECCATAAEFVACLDRQRIGYAMRGGGFLISRGTLVQLGEGDVRDAVDWLIHFGVTGGDKVGGYSIGYTSPVSPYGERFYFFPLK